MESALKSKRYFQYWNDFKRIKNPTVVLSMCKTTVGIYNVSVCLELVCCGSKKHRGLILQGKAPAILKPEADVCAAVSQVLSRVRKPSTGCANGFSPALIGKILFQDGKEDVLLSVRFSRSRFLNCDLGSNLISIFEVFGYLDLKPPETKITEFLFHF